MCGSCLRLTNSVTTEAERFFAAGIMAGAHIGKALMPYMGECDKTDQLRRALVATGLSSGD